MRFAGDVKISPSRIDGQAHTPIDRRGRKAWPN